MFKILVKKKYRQICKYHRNFFLWVCVSKFVSSNIWETGYSKVEWQEAGVGVATNTTCVTCAKTFLALIYLFILHIHFSK